MNPPEEGNVLIILVFVKFRKNYLKHLHQNFLLNQNNLYFFLRNKRQSLKTWTWDKNGNVPVIVCVALNMKKD